MRKLLIFVTLLLLTSCAYVKCPGVSLDGTDTAAFKQSKCRQNMISLEAALVALGGDIDGNESRLLAQEAVYHSMRLAESYELIRPPILHNTYVNTGVRKRGLCIHWTEDLLKHFEQLELKGFQFFWGIAEGEGLFRIQHSSVVVTAKDKPFDEGIVLDPWRNSGRLYWGLVKEDKYPWKKWQYYPPK